MCEAHKGAKDKIEPKGNLENGIHSNDKATSGAKSVQLGLIQTE